MQSNDRIGVLGGTFDPPHIGHLTAAVEVRDVLGLAEVLLVVAGDPWQKSGDRVLTPATDRLAMVEAAVRGLDGLVACDLEIRRGGPSYMVDTLTELAALHPGVGFDLIVGADAAVGLPTWHRPADLAAMCRLVVVDREGDALAAVPDGFDLRRVRVPRLDVSSSEMRRRIVEGRPIAPMVPPAVRDVLTQRRLYL